MSAAISGTSIRPYRFISSIFNHPCIAAAETSHTYSHDSETLERGGKEGGSVQVRDWAALGGHGSTQHTRHSTQHSTALPQRQQQQKRLHAHDTTQHSSDNRQSDEMRAEQSRCLVVPPLDRDRHRTLLILSHTAAQHTEQHTRSHAHILWRYAYTAQHSTGPTASLARLLQLAPLTVPFRPSLFHRTAHSTCHRIPPPLQCHTDLHAPSLPSLLNPSFAALDRPVRSTQPTVRPLPAFIILPLAFMSS